MVSKVANAKIVREYHTCANRGASHGCWAAPVPVVCLPSMMYVRCVEGGKRVFAWACGQEPSPAPNSKGHRKIIRTFEACARLYTVRTHARKTTSSVMGAYIVDGVFTCRCSTVVDNINHVRLNSSVYPRRRRERRGHLPGKTNYIGQAVSHVRIVRRVVRERAEGLQGVEECWWRCNRDN